MLKEDALPPGYTVKKRMLVKVKSTKTPGHQPDSRTFKPAA
ncbi:MAG: hypothetical protein ACRCYU_19360 [Nocardioides sp.]